MKKNLLIKIAIFCIVLFNTIISNGQSTYGPIQTLWVCPTDTAVKLMYKMGNIDQTFIVRTPLTLDASVTINGELTISEGSFEQIERKGNMVRTKSVSVKKGYLNEMFLYYGTENKPTITFVGSCSDGTNQWTDWNTFWETGDTIKILYRTMSLKGGKSKIEIKGPDDYLNGAFIFSGDLIINDDKSIKCNTCCKGAPDPDLCSGFNISQTAPIYTSEFNISEIKSVQCVMKVKKYRKDKLPKVKRHPSADGVRG